MVLATGMVDHAVRTEPSAVVVTVPEDATVVDVAAVTASVLVALYSPNDSDVVSLRRCEGASRGGNGVGVGVGEGVCIGGGGVMRTPAATWPARRRSASMCDG